MEIIPTIVALLFAAALLGIYVGSVAWAVGDAQKRGHGGGIVVVFFWLFGPVSAIIWLIVRPGTKLIDQSPVTYDNADDAIAAASAVPGEAGIGWIMGRVGDCFRKVVRCTGVRL